MGSTISLITFLLSAILNKNDVKIIKLYTSASNVEKVATITSQNLSNYERMEPPCLKRQNPSCSPIERSQLPVPSPQKKIKVDDQNHQSFLIISNSNESLNVDVFPYNPQFCMLYHIPQKSSQTYSITDPRFFVSLEPQKTILIPILSELVQESEEHTREKIGKYIAERKGDYQSDCSSEKKRLVFEELLKEANDKQVLKKFFLCRKPNNSKGYFRSNNPTNPSQNGSKLNFGCSRLPYLNLKVIDYKYDGQLKYSALLRWNNFYNCSMKLESFLKAKKDQYLSNGPSFKHMLRFLNSQQENINLVINDADLDILIYQQNKFRNIPWSVEKYIWELLDKGETRLLPPQFEDLSYDRKKIKEIKTEIHKLTTETNYKFVELVKVKFTGVEVSRKLNFSQSDDAPELQITLKTVDFEPLKIQTSEDWDLKEIRLIFSGLNIITQKKGYYIYPLSLKNMNMDLDFEIKN